MMTHNCTHVAHDRVTKKVTPCDKDAEFMDVSRPLGTETDVNGIPRRKIYCAAHADKYDKMVEACGDAMRKSGPEPTAEWVPLTDELLTEYREACQTAYEKYEKKRKRALR